MLQQSKAARDYSATFEVGSVNDPEDFLEHLRSAYAITRFWVTFTRPNAIDANADFIRPMEKLLREADGTKGKTDLEGQNLKAETLESLSRSAAATGDDAGASIQTDPDQGKTRVSLKGNAVVITHEEPEDDDQKRGLLWKIKETYQRIRQGGSQQGLRAVTFWQWLLQGSGGAAGIRRIINRWLLVHSLVGLILALAVPIDLQSAASAVLLPLAGVLVGLSFAWAGNAQALLQTEEVESLSEYHPGGFVEYVYIYSLAILCILITLADGESQD